MELHCEYNDTQVGRRDDVDGVDTFWFNLHQYGLELLVNVLLEKSLLGFSDQSFK